MVTLRPQQIFIRVENRKDDIWNFYSIDLFIADFKLIRASDGESSLEEEKKNEK